MRRLSKRALQSRLYELARRRADERGLAFDLDVEGIVVPHFCPVLGLELKSEPGPMTERSATLDRIEPALGYVEGNVLVVSARANRLKSDASIDELCHLAGFYQQLSR